MNKIKTHLMFPIVAVFLFLLITELLIRSVSVIFPKVNSVLTKSQYSDTVKRSIADSKLNRRPNPEFKGHDKNGWRNQFVPSNVDIVALGDSQTYGTGVPPYKTWPQQLQESSKLSVYNMSYGGYGPSESLILLSEALKMKPTVIIEAFYSGNDLYDCFDVVYGRGQLPNLRNNDPKLIKEFELLESEESVEKKSIKVHEDRGKNKGLQKYLKFSKYSKTWGLLLAVDRFIMKGIIDKISKYQFVLDNGKFKTVFTQDYRLVATDLENLIISEGLRICLDSIEEIKNITTRKEVDFFVLLIPTKELVFKEIMFSLNQDIPSVYIELLNNEELIWEKTKRFLDERNIEYVDALPNLRKLIQQGVNPYPSTTNGHPNPLGQGVLADSVLEFLN